jgi:hypothetical protein
MKKFINKFQSLKGATIIGINGYESKTTGEVANHQVNVNISVENAKKTDLNLLYNCSDAVVLKVADKGKIALDIVRLALSELVASAEKNLSAKVEDRSAQSQGQTDAYIYLTPAIRLHKDTMNVHIFGQGMSKQVLVEGEYKTVNSAPKTIAKNMLKKELNLRSDKFRDFILGNVDSLKVNGTTIEFVR